MDEDLKKMSTSEQIPKLPSTKDPKELPPATQLTLEYLKEQTTEFVNTFNRRDFEALEKQWSSHVDHDRFVGTVVNFSPALSWKEHMDVYRHMAHAEPNLQIVPKKIDFDINEGEGTAELYIFSEDVGHSGGITSNGLSVLSWRQKRGGQWLCIKHTIFQSMGDMVGGIDFR